MPLIRVVQPVSCERSIADESEGPKSDLGIRCPSLTWRGRQRITQRNAFPDREIFRGESDVRISVDGQNGSGAHASYREAVILHSNNAIIFVEDRHSTLDARPRADETVLGCYNREQEKT